MNTTKIIERVSKYDFREIIISYSSRICVSPHACDHLNTAQRALFNEEQLKKILLEENPRGIGRQRNGRYALFYKRKNGFIKIICEAKHNKFEIITFINVDNMPDIRRLDNEKETS